MPANDALQEISDTLSATESTPRLILITRDEVKKERGDKSKKKQYSYDALRASISPDLSLHLIRTTKGTIDHVLKNQEIVVQEYDAIADDSPDILFEYPIERLKNFAEVLPKIKDSANIGAVKGIAEISTTLWAYCFVVDVSESDTRFIFRRLKKAKITTDEPQSLKEKFYATFSLDTATLTMAAKEMIAFDEHIDCILSNGKFLILNKHPFEQLVGIEDEFIEQSNEVIGALQRNDIIEDVSLLSQAILDSPQLLRQVTCIARKGYYTAIDKSNFQEMSDILHRMTGRNLIISENGKIQLADKESVKDLIKLLNDFWKQGLVSKKIYGSNSGEIIDE